jgi:4'-phosphopantetheinyl transferase
MRSYLEVPRVSPWQMRTDCPELDEAAVHVWRIHLDQPDMARALRHVLSPDERARADRFYAEQHRTRFAIAHGWLRLVLGRYLREPPESLSFSEGEHGKPVLRGAVGARGIDFNLSHSSDVALVAVAGGPVGVDVERQAEDVEHLDLAKRFFSADECAALQTVADVPAAVVDGFFATWTRKEAYLKATGHGITRGLRHFDVTYLPGMPARLLADRRDADATNRWAIASFDAAPGYSAAVVAEAPMRDVELFEPSGPDWLSG